MSQDFLAYETSVVLENFHKKIEVLEVLDKQLLAGLGDGSLVVLEPGKGAEGTHWQVTKALKNFGQRRITQLQVQCLHPLAVCQYESLFQQSHTEAGSMSGVA